MGNAGQTLLGHCPYFMKSDKMVTKKKNFWKWPNTLKTTKHLLSKADQNRNKWSIPSSLYPLAARKARAGSLSSGLVDVVERDIDVRLTASLLQTCDQMGLVCNGISESGPRSQSGNDREIPTSPPGHHWEAKIALTTTAKLHKLRANTPLKWHDLLLDPCNDHNDLRNWTIAA